MLKVQINKILPNGDCALLIRFAESDNRLAAIHALAKDLMRPPLPAMINTKIVNIIPATDSLVLVFSAPIVDIAGLFDVIQERVEHLSNHQYTVQTHDIPVCYDPAVAVDVLAVCGSLALSHEQLIELHTEPVYRVDMLGFLPGFAYLSGNHSALNLPRKETPVIQLEAGSLAIANHQTGIYSLASPGGWHVIGRTPVHLLDWQNQQQPMALNPLDEVKFKPISLADYRNLVVNDNANSVDNYD